MKLHNHGYTLIANNCCGGIIYHSLGEQFLSPTINLFIPTDDYFCFLENLEEALSTEIHEIKIDKTGATAPFPIGEMCLKNGSTIQIHFMHYPSFEEAKTKWEERCRRVKTDNLFVLMELGPKTTREYAEKFQNLPFPNKVAITNTKFDDLDATIHIDIYGPTYKPGQMVRRMPRSSHLYIELFDFVTWFNTGKIQHAKFYKKFIQ